MLLLLFAFVVVSGCSCNKDIYKFDSIVMSNGNETKTYTCSDDDKKDANVKSMCDNLEGITIEFKDDENLIINYPAYNMENEEERYKIEDGYLYMEDGNEWMKFAKYSDKQIELEIGLAKVILKK